MSPAMIKKSAWDSMVWSTTRRKAPSVAAVNCCFKAADAFPMPRNGLSRCKSAAWTNRNGSIHQLYGLQRPEQVSRLKKNSNFAKKKISHENSCAVASRRKHLEQRKPFHGLDGCRPQPQGHRRSKSR